MLQLFLKYRYKVNLYWVMMSPNRMLVYFFLYTDRASPLNSTRILFDVNLGLLLCYRTCIGVIET